MQDVLPLAAPAELAPPLGVPARAAASSLAAQNVGGGMVADGVSSCMEVSQLDDDVFPPSNCWITLLLMTSADLLLE
jgi:hypothetical protein